MKKTPLLLVSLALAASAAQAQTTVLACQFAESGGFIYKGNRWQSTSFNLERPFFIKLKPDGVIDESSLAGVGMTYAVECRKPYGHRPEFVRCSGSSDLVVFSTKTLSGAVSVLHGAASDSSSRDTLSISTFNCQKM